MKNITIKQLVLLITYTVLLLAALFNMNTVIGGVNYVLTVLRPLIIGVVLALTMDGLVCYFERKVFTKAPPRAARPLSVAVAVICVLGTIVALLWFLVPSLLKSLGGVLESMPRYITTALEYIDGIAEKLGIKTLPSEAILNDWQRIANNLTGSMSSIAVTLIGFTNTVIRGLLGVTFSVYVLLDKKRVKNMLRRLLNALLGQKNGGKTYAYIEVCAVTYKTFISGQVIEAFILGGLCFIGMVIIGLPYAPIISALVGVTSLIPVVGPYIGLILSALLLLLENPIQALIFVIFFLALQQLDSAVLYPRVVGGAIGVDGIFVFVGITLGAGFGGTIGLLAGVPLIAVLRAATGRMIRNKERKAKLVEQYNRPAE